MSVLHELYAIKIRDHRLDAKIILSVTKCVQKCLRNRTTNKKIQILRGKWAKSQTISKEKYKRCLVREICWPVPERGRSVSYRESWHMCRTLGVIHRTSSLLVWPPGKSETKVLGSTISLICDMASTSRMHTAISSGQCLYIWRESYGLILELTLHNHKETWAWLYELQLISSLPDYGCPWDWNATRWIFAN